MANRITYELGCGRGESFDFSRSPANDVSGNSLAYGLGECSAPIPEPIELALSFVSNEATPELIGFSEFADQSAPPKKYLRKDGDGRIDRFDYSFNPGPNYCEGACSGGSDAQSYEGYDSYNAITGALTINSVIRTFQDTYACPPASEISQIFGLPADFGPAGVVPDEPFWEKSYTKTIASLTGLENCVPSPLESNRIKNASGERTMTLSLEDTEDNAISRASYTAGTSDTATRTARANLFTFTYRYTDPTAACVDLEVGGVYYISYDVTHTPIASGTSYTQSLVKWFTAVSETQNVALDRLIAQSGFSCKITRCTITKV